MDPLVVGGGGAVHHPDGALHPLRSILGERIALLKVRRGGGNFQIVSLSVIWLKK